MDFLNLLVQVFLSSTVIFNIADAACRPDQIKSCQEAAKSNKLDNFHAGGKCQAKHYVQFTHVCTVSNYLPSTDFCCCVTDRKVLCCRYQQDWDIFRCTQADDTIDTMITRTTPTIGGHTNGDSGSSNSVFGNNSPLKKLPLYILIPMIVGPIALVVCCIVCIIKCCCYNYEGDDIEYCDIPCVRKCRNKQPEKQNIYHSTTQRGTSLCDEEQPLSSATARYMHPSGVGSQFSTESTSSETKLLPSRSSDGPMPSAPHCDLAGGVESASYGKTHHRDHNIGCIHHPGYSRLDSESSSIITGDGGGAPYQCGYSRSVSSGLTNQNGGRMDSSSGAEGLMGSSNGGGGGCPGCVVGVGVGTPPPTYEEHHKDRVIT